MRDTEISQWIKTDFLPLTLSIPDETILQAIGNVTRFFNTHSAHRQLKMYSLNGTNAIQIDNSFKNVLQVLPSKQATTQALADPTWTLLGIQSMNYLTSDLININEAYKNYSAYFGTDFQWTFEPSQDPSIGGMLYLQYVPSTASKLAVIGAKRILPNEDIVEEHILDWILRASKAYVKMIESNVLRKAKIIGIAQDGDDMMKEGTEEWQQLKDELLANGRWFAMGSRM